MLTETEVVLALSPSINVKMVFVYRVNYLFFSITAIPNKEQLYHLHALGLITAELVTLNHIRGSKIIFYYQFSLIKSIMTFNGIQKSPSSAAKIFIQPTITSLFKITHLQ